MSKPPIFFVQTMIDRFVSEDLNTFKEENQNLISKHLGIPKSEINYFLVDSTYKEMAEKYPDDSEELKTESGYAELEDFFQQFQQQTLKRKDEFLSRQLLGDVRQAIEENLQPHIQELIEIYKARTEELSELVNQLNRMSKDITEWKQQTFPKIKQDIQSRIEDCLDEAKNDLNSELGHGYRGSKASPISNSVIDEYLNLYSVESIADLRKPENISKMQDRCIQVCEDRFLYIINKTQQEVVNIIDEGGAGLEKSIEDALESSYDAEGKRRFANTNIKIAHLSPKPNGIKIISDIFRKANPVLIVLHIAVEIAGGPAVILAHIGWQLTAALFFAPGRIWSTSP